MSLRVGHKLPVLLTVGERSLSVTRVSARAETLAVVRCLGDRAMTGDEISLDNRISLVKYYARCSALCHQWQPMKLTHSIQSYRYPQRAWFAESSATCRYYFGFFFSFLSYRWFLDRWVG
jgi:hypothetical protein